MTNGKRLEWKIDKNADIKSPRTFQMWQSWQGKQQMSEQKLTPSVTYNPAFQNAKSIIKELLTLLTLNKENKEIFPNMPAIKSLNSKSFKN